MNLCRGACAHGYDRAGLCKAFLAGECPQAPPTVLVIEIPADRVASVKATLAAHAIQWKQPEVATLEDRARLARAVAQARENHDEYQRLMDAGDVRHGYSDANHIQRAALLDLVEGLLAGKVRI